MIELRGLEKSAVGNDTVCTAVVRTAHPDIYEKKELFRNKPVNRGQVLKALAEIFNVPAGKIIWPAHIKVD